MLPFPVVGPRPLALAGGAQIICSTLVCSAGLVVRVRGKDRLITAGHGVGKAGSIVTDVSGVRIGTVETNFYRDDTTVDLALVGIDATYQDYEVDTVQLTIGSDSSLYRGIRNATTRPAQGTFVMMISPTNGAEFGRIIHPDADVTDLATGRKVTNVCVADYPSKPSDSGAPVISGLQDAATCFGFHGGRIVAQGAATHAWFTPLDNIDL